jgi:hypothetical protein
MSGFMQHSTCGGKIAGDPSIPLFYKVKTHAVEEEENYLIYMDRELHAKGESRIVA